MNGTDLSPSEAKKLAFLNPLYFHLSWLLPLREQSKFSNISQIDWVGLHQLKTILRQVQLWAETHK